MKAVQFQGVDTLALAEIEPPKVADDEVLVTLRSVGICHSDFELLEGRYIIPFD
jgi:L-iditol 2-dehydrogenase